MPAPAPHHGPLLERLADACTTRLRSGRSLTRPSAVDRLLLGARQGQPEAVRAALRELRAPGRLLSSSPEPRRLARFLLATTPCVPRRRLGALLDAAPESSQDQRLCGLVAGTMVALLSLTRAHGLGRSLRPLQPELALLWLYGGQRGPQVLISLRAGQIGPLLAAVDDLASQPDAARRPSLRPLRFLRFLADCLAARQAGRPRPLWNDARGAGSDLLRRLTDRLQSEVLARLRTDRQFLVDPSTAPLDYPERRGAALRQAIDGLEALLDLRDLLKRVARSRARRGGGRRPRMREQLALLRSDPRALDHRRFGQQLASTVNFVRARCDAGEYHLAMPERLRDALSESADLVALQNRLGPLGELGLTPGMGFWDEARLVPLRSALGDEGGETDER